MANKKIEVTDLLPMALDAIVSRLQLFETLRAAELQTRQVDWRAVEQERAYVETALDVIRSFCFLPK